jgi:M-phase inducer tyrosine phosphatase
MYAALREIDRRLNMQWYPQIFYSEIYILEGGYSQFHCLYPQLCNGGYVRMDDKKEEGHQKFGKHKRDYKEFHQ